MPRRARSRAGSAPSSASRPLCGAPRSARRRRGSPRPRRRKGRRDEPAFPAPPSAPILRCSLGREPPAFERWEAEVLPRVRAVSLTNYFEVARFVGLDPYEMLRRANISPTALADPDHLLASAPVTKLLEDSARESGCLSFGLLMAEPRSVASVGA